MFLVWLCSLVGRVIVRLPEPWLETLSRGLGRCLYRAPLSRMRLLRANIDHAFPERDAAWRARVGRLSCVRLAEMALFALASPFLPEERLRRMFTIGEKGAVELEALLACPSGVVVLIPHICYFEMLSLFPLVEPRTRGTGVLFRPLKQPALDRLVRDSRQRFGLRMLSRREGNFGMRSILRRGGIVAMLFDQDAGRHGKLSIFMERLVSTTDYPGMLCRRSGAAAWMLFPRRTGFWRAEAQFLPIADPGTPGRLLVEADRKLEDYLRTSPEQCAEWLWAHDRWGVHCGPRRRFQLREGQVLDQWLLSRGRTALPRRTRIWVRLPNWLGDVIMAVPLIRALARGRPDAELTLLGQEGHLQLLRSWGIGHAWVALPPRKPTLAYLAFFRARRAPGGATYLTLTNSFRGDLEGRLMRFPQRWGMVRPGRKRPLLTEGWKVPESLDETAVHQLLVWRDYFRNFGLMEEPDRRPVGSVSIDARDLGLICGTENTPSKRWPVARWRELIERVLEQEDRRRLVLFGTPRDREITARVAAGFPEDRVADRAGETGLTEFADELSRCRCVICNDTGGMHLANALGIPVVAVFGPTNPVRTGPVFDAPKVLLQPPGCPPGGGADIAGVSVEAVLSKVAELQGGLNG